MPDLRRYLINFTLPEGPLGIGIRRNKKGVCIVSSVTNPNSPLRLNDAIVSLNGSVLKNVAGGIGEVVKLFESSATEWRRVEILRLVCKGSSIDMSHGGLLQVASDGQIDDDTIQAIEPLVVAAPKPAAKKLAAKKPAAKKSRASGPTKQRAANDEEETTSSYAKLTETKTSTEGHVAPLDITVTKYGLHKYPRLLRAITDLSDRQKEYLETTTDPVPDGLCSEIMFVDFKKTLAPIPIEQADKVPFTNDSIINKFYFFVSNMLEACESGSIGGDACRMRVVLLAALDDISAFRNSEQIEHLLGLTLAIRFHGLGAFIQRGDPDSGRLIFGEIAKMWKKFHDPTYDPACWGINDDVRAYSREVCEGVQKMLKSGKELHGEYAENYNFNYIRIPRPKRTKAAQLQKQKENADPSSSNSNSGEKRKSEGDETASKKKAKPPSEAMQLVERINAVEGVSDDVVYDTCPELRMKIKAFLARKGMTKKILCIALGNINHNSLNRFLQASEQEQSGNATYRKGYVFIEKLRILEGQPKSAARLRNEQNEPSGFDLSKPKGGRPCSYLFDPNLVIKANTGNQYSMRWIRSPQPYSRMETLVKSRPFPNNVVIQEEVIETTHGSEYVTGRRHWINSVIASSLIKSAAAPALAYNSATLASAATPTVSKESIAMQPAICDAAVESYRKGSNEIQIVGTAHISSASAQLSGNAVRETKPDAVFLELDMQRIGRAFRKGIVDRPITVLFFTGEDPGGGGKITLQSAVLAEQDMEKGAGGLANFLLKRFALKNPIQELYESLEAQGITPGEEFITAVEEGVHRNSLIILGDRSIDVTFRRIANALVFHTEPKRLADAERIISLKLKDHVPELAQWEDNVKRQRGPLSNEEIAFYVERMKTKEITNSILGEMKKVAPELYMALVGERDVYMAHSMDLVFSPSLPSILPPSHLSQSPRSVQSLVAVVGLAHLSGIGNELKSLGWRQFTPPQC